MRPNGIPRLQMNARYSVIDVCNAWRLDDETRAAIIDQMRKLKHGFAFGDDYFAFGESISKAFFAVAMAASGSAVKG